MPHVVYLAASLFCPWPGCGHRIELIDFQLEKVNDPGLYARVMTAWALSRLRPDRHVVRDVSAMCCCGATAKQRVEDPAITGLPVLPDDWHQTAYIG